jgi:predicted nucleic acid-binding protein
MTFDQLRPGDEVFLDANIFIYYYLGSSQQCRLLLDQCRQGVLRGHTATFVLAEVVHRLMLIEAVERQLATPGKVVKQLREKPAIIQQLSKYSAAVPQIKAMNIEISPLNLTTLEISADVRKQHGLLTNDSLLVAAMQELNMQKLATLDRDFARISGLLTYQPTDVSPTT